MNYWLYLPHLSSIFRNSHLPKLIASGMFPSASIISRRKNQLRFLIWEIVFSAWDFYNIFVGGLLLCNFLLLQRSLFSLIRSNVIMHFWKVKYVLGKFLHWHRSFPGSGRERGWGSLLGGRRKGKRSWEKWGLSGPSRFGKRVCDDANLQQCKKAEWKHDHNSVYKQHTNLSFSCFFFFNITLHLFQGI